MAILGNFCIGNEFFLMNSELCELRTGALIVRVGGGRKVK